MLSAFDPDLEYPCCSDVSNRSSINRSTGFNKLMHMVINAQHFSLEEIEEYIQSNPDELEAENDGGYTPLLLACCNSSTSSSDSVVRLLINAKANVERTGIINQTPLLASCSRLGTDSSLGSDSLSSGHSLGSGSNLEAVRLLIEAGVDVNRGGRRGRTALYMCCGSVHPNSHVAAQLLIEAGADVNQADDEGITPLINTCFRFRDASSIDTVRMLIAAGADVNRFCEDGSTAMYNVAGFSNDRSLDIVKALIAAGADVNIADNTDTTPLIRSCSGLGSHMPTSNVETVIALIAAGADVNAQNEEGLTALEEACYGASSDDCVTAVRALIRAGADVNVLIDGTETAFDLCIGGYMGIAKAVSPIQEQVLELLLQGGAVITKFKSDGTERFNTSTIYSLDVYRFLKMHRPLATITSKQVGRAIWKDVQQIESEYAKWTQLFKQSVLPQVLGHTRSD